jgi:hypothetical protein
MFKHTRATTVVSQPLIFSISSDSDRTKAQPCLLHGGGKLTASVTDPDGNVIGLIQSPS